MAAATTVPIDRAETTIVKVFLSVTVFTIIKNSISEQITGTDCKSASKRLRDKIEEAKTTAPKIKSGVVKGFEMRTIFLLRTVLTPQIIRSTRLAKITKSCFGNTKKSVVVVRKTIGRKNKTKEIITTLIFWRSISASFLVDLSISFTVALQKV